MQAGHLMVIGLIEGIPKAALQFGQTIACSTSDCLFFPEWLGSYENRYLWVFWRYFGEPSPSSLVVNLLSLSGREWAVFAWFDGLIPPLRNSSSWESISFSVIPSSLEILSIARVLSYSLMPTNCWRSTAGILDTLPDRREGFQCPRKDDPLIGLFPVFDCYCESLYFLWF